MAKGYKTGGRQKGTPNKKDSPLKTILREHSTQYFTPRPQVDSNGAPRKLSVYVNGEEVKVMVLADSKGKPLVMSDCEVDMMQLDPSDRIMAHLKILKFHTPEMKSVDLDMDIHGSASLSIEERLKELVNPQKENL